MRISVTDARALAAALSTAADTAEQAGQTDFDVAQTEQARIVSAIAADKTAHQELLDAIAKAS